MSLLFESIACEGGRLKNLDYHQDRVSKSIRALRLQVKSLDLSKINIPEYTSSGLWKCRVSYDDQFQDIKFSKYIPKPIKTFKLVEADIEYPYKYEDRSSINALFLKKSGFDDIIIARRSHITDSSYGNIIFYDGSHWFTPTTPLLPGIMRAYLLSKGMIGTKEIKVKEIPYFEKFMMINALNPFDEARALPINNIKI